jgi:hypothetical protein
MGCLGDDPCVQKPSGRHPRLDGKGNVKLKNAAHSISWKASPTGDRSGGKATNPSREPDSHEMGRRVPHC